jgi:hypothetical protein
MATRFLVEPPACRTARRASCSQLFGTRRRNGQGFRLLVITHRERGPNHLGLADARHAASRAKHAVGLGPSSQLAGISGG